MKQGLLIGLFLLAGCSLDKPDDGNSYTLYRGSTAGPMRIHVASFDASDGDDYNRDNCDIARRLFQAQSGVTVRYWCEKGRYRS
jgi:hypothetical protein